MPPNHALQRTEAGVRLFSVYHAFSRQPLSLSLEALGPDAIPPMPTKSEQVAKARQRRSHPTVAQADLRRLIRDHGDRLKRQVLIGRSLIHFILPDRNLLINVFGEHLQRDASQTERLDGWLKSLGFCYLELTNAEVFDSPRKVIEAIESFPECIEAYQRYRSAKRAAHKYELTKSGETSDNSDPTDPA